MGVYESVKEGNRLRAAELAERQEEAEAARAVQAAEAEARDLDERREPARRAARLAYLAKWQSGGAWVAAANAANSAQATFAAVVADPSSTVERLFLAYSDAKAAVAATAVLRNAIDDYRFRATNPGESPMPRYLDRTPQPSFDDLLTQVIASRSLAAAKAVQVPTEVFAKADEAGDKAAAAIE